MKYKFMFCFMPILLFGCGGGNNLDTGNYSVKHEIAFSTDPNSHNGDVFYSKWEISIKEDKYLMSINDGATILNGHDVEEKTLFYFNKEDGDECPFYTHMFAELEKTDQGFSGNSTQVYDFCVVYNTRDGILKMESWAIEYKVVGKLDD